MKWVKVVRPKTRGDLGNGNVENKNRTLLVKWLWRFLLEKTFLWHSVIRNKHRIRPNGWDANMVRNVEAPRKLNLKSTQLFLVLLP